ncbi:hypothetical protein K0M31_012893 [Melipona bicolor]|uniref:Uncharacterized protein n=1 Tax=Melipona bicolor TaxID=60889 RepID=A0AA40KGS3_9HYME|nr:hypothetical protein K0M31_012893 [Melipona bicolor]
MVAMPDCMNYIVEGTGEEDAGVRCTPGNDKMFSMGRKDGREVIREELSARLMSM